MTSRRTPPGHRSLALILAASSSGCGLAGAPSYDLFGAFFPAWMFCALTGIVGAIAARVAFVGTGISDVLPLQRVVCPAIGLIVAILVWMLCFGL